MKIGSRREPLFFLRAPEKDASKGHIHQHALRMVSKWFLADYWIVKRTMLGVPTEKPLYAEAVLGHEHHHISPPTERGWACESPELEEVS